MYNKHREKSIAEESCSIAEESCLKKGSDEEVYKKLNLRFMYPFKTNRKYAKDVSLEAYNQFLHWSKPRTLSSFVCHHGKAP